MKKALSLFFFDWGYIIIGRKFIRHKREIGIEQRIDRKFQLKEKEEIK